MTLNHSTINNLTTPYRGQDDIRNFNSDYYIPGTGDHYFETPSSSGGRGESRVEQPQSSNNSYTLKTRVLSGPRSFHSDPAYNKSSEVLSNRGDTTNDACYSNRLQNSPAMSILCLTTMSEINPHLFISGASPVNEYKVRGKGITFIVNVTLDYPNLRIPGVETLAIRIDDSPSSQLYPYFDKVADKIKEVSAYSSNSAATGKTLVHCMVGASRSATLVLAYLMKHRGMSLLQAYSFLKRIRPVVRPNPGFFKQLICYEYALFGHNTVRMVIAPTISSSGSYPYRGLIPDVYLCD